MTPVNGSQICFMWQMASTFPCEIVAIPLKINLYPHGFDTFSFSKTKEVFHWSQPQFVFSEVAEIQKLVPIHHLYHRLLHDTNLCLIQGKDTSCHLCILFPRLLYRIIQNICKSTYTKISTCNNIIFVLKLFETTSRLLGVKHVTTTEYHFQISSNPSGVRSG